MIRRYRWAICSGLLMGTSYIPLPPWAILFCWVPLWLDIAEEKSLKQVFFKGWIAQFILTNIGFHWIAYDAYEFGHFPWPLAIGTLFLFSALQFLNIPIAMTLAKWLSGKLELGRGGLFVLIASLNVAAEVFWPAIFPFNHGYPIYYARLPIAQIADIIGILGLSFFVHLVNAEIAWLWDRKNRNLTFKVAVASVLAFVALNGLGIHRRSQWVNAPDTKKLRVLQVQANIGNFEKLQAERGLGFQEEISRRFFEQTELGLKEFPDVDLIVWPETAYPDFLGAHNSNRVYTRRLEEFVQSTGKYLITGSYGNDPPQKFPRSDYNSLFLYSPDPAVPPQSYFKTYLLIFGEYTPFGDYFPILKKYNPGGEGWGRGSGPITLNYKNIQIGAQICYEGLYPEFSRALVQNGADIFVNLTNDSWFGRPFEPWQHMIMTMSRAVENRRPLIRSTNTGITAVALADGSILSPSPIWQEWRGVYDVEYLENGPVTFYTRYGAFFPLVILLVVLLACVLGRNRLRRL